MYKNFFGFKERPFQLVPNPDYLFLSRSHEEALAHLTYAVSEGEGFVEITGEVGTGKTTLCRAFLENLTPDTEAAYIFNPKLDAAQLLKSINDEFGIPSDANNIKDLIDTLNIFLIKKRTEGKSVILVIDEAQNLSKEVLEQLRLLSNLETTTAKLLQIILVGQPELGDMLDSYELRQLGQRITLSCYLMPLNFKETREYIQHRLQIASRKPGIRFTRAAYRVIHKYSKGIPRLINIVCDRSLLTAFSLEKHKITGSIAKTAIKELAGRGERKKELWEGKKGVLIFAALCLILFLIILYPPGFQFTELQKIQILKPQTKNIPLSLIPDETIVKEETAKESEPATIITPDFIEDSENQPEPVNEVVQNLGYFLREIESRSSRHTALEIAMKLWHTDAVIKTYLDEMDDEQHFFQIAAKQNGLLVHQIEEESRFETGSGFDLMKKLNLPAILMFHSSESSNPVYLTLSRISEGKFTLRGGEKDEIIVAEPNEVEYYWSGVAYILWKNFYAYSGTIPREASEDAVITLKMLLKDIGYSDIEINATYDEQARKAVEDIQEKHGLNVDGVVGPLTRIIIYNELESLDIPYITD